MQTRTSSIRENRLANLLLEASPVATVLTSSHGCIEVVNHVTETWFGYRESELIGKSFDTLFPSGSKGSEVSHPACFLSQMSDVDVGTEWDLLGRRKNGTTFPVRMTLHPLVTVSGDMLLANVLNLTQTDSRFERRIAGERLAAVLEMVSGLAHESRNALQRAQSCLELLELDLSDQFELLQLTDRIRSALKDLHNNYEEVKSYASPITLKLTAVHFSQLFQVAFDEVIDEHPQSSAELHVECDDECARLSVDESRMRQVFHNILENAIQASPPRTAIECICRRMSTPQGNSVEIMLRDHGAGFNEETGRRMFEPFYTTKQQGTGLGLPVCRRILEAHGGTIEAKNHSDGGVVVRIVLPS